jgi:hypothetical protein
MKLGRLASFGLLVPGLLLAQYPAMAVPGGAQLSSRTIVKKGERIMLKEGLIQPITINIVTLLAFLITTLLLILLPSTPANAATTWISCVPVQVMNYRSRVHVKCAAPVGGISYFAASTSDSAFAARTLSTISTAQVAGRTLTILYDPADASGTTIGCQANDCRLIQAVGFGQ